MFWWRPALAKRAEQWIFEPLQPQAMEPERVADVKPDASYLRLCLRSLRIVQMRRGRNQFCRTVHSSISLQHASGAVTTIQKLIRLPDLKKVGPTHLNRLIPINETLLNYVPYKGGNLGIEVGLFSIRSAKRAESCLKLLAELSVCAGVSYVSVSQPFVEPIRYGFGLLTNSDTPEILEIGLQATFKRPQTGWFAVLGAPVKSVNLSQLKVAANDYRLIDQAGNTLRDYAYMVFSIEAVPNREDWHTIPDLQEPYQQLLRDVRGANTRYLESLAVFKRVAVTCPDLVAADAQRLGELAQEYAEKGFVPRQTAAIDDVQIMPELKDLPLYPHLDRVEVLRVLEDSRDQPPSFYFQLKGEEVQGKQVKCGTEVDCIFNYGVPSIATITIGGKKLDEVVKPDANVHLGIAVIPRGFTMRDSIWYQQAKFEAGKLVQPVCFKLIADKQPVENAELYMIFDRAGSALYEFSLPLKVVKALDPTDTSLSSMPMHLDLDEVLAATNRLERTVRLHLWAQGDQLNFVFYNHVTGESFGGMCAKLTRTALADRVGKIRNTLAPVTDHTIWSMIDEHIATPTASVQKAFPGCLEQVVDAGASLYAALAGDEQLREVFHRINQLPPDSRLSIMTDCAFLPWEILYPRRYDTAWTQKVKDANSIQVQELWGYRFAIECLLMAKGTSYKSPVEAHKGGKLFVSVNLNPTIDEKFVNSAFKPVQAQAKWTSEWANAYDPGVVTVEINTSGNNIKQMLQTQDYAATLIYLYCHGSNDHPFQDDQSEMLELDKNITIDPDFLNDGLRFRRGPIVFINSCSSGAFSPLSFVNFLSRFRDKQAVGLIATSFPVPATFAAAFGHVVIESYMRDQLPIGEVLLKWRRQLLNQKNPLGLFYALQCPMDVTAPAVE